MVGLPTISPEKLKGLRWATVASLAVASVMAAVLTRHWRVVNDAAQLDYVCFMMDHGFAPYRQLFEMNMPGIYLTNWTVLHTLGKSDLAWRIFDTSLMAALTASMIVICRRGIDERDDRAGWFAGFFGGVLFALYHLRDGAGQMGQRDLIIGVLLVCAYAFMFEALRRRDWRLMFGLGLCASAAGTMKPTPLPFAVLLIVLAMMRWRKLGYGNVAAPLLAALAGMATPLLAALGFLLRFHAVHAFAYILRVVLPYYAPLARMDFGTMMIVGGTESVRTMVVLAAAIALLRRETWPKWENAMVLLGVMFGMASYFAQHKGFTYHRYPMLVFLFLWSAWQLGDGLRQARRPLIQWLAAVGICFGAVVAPVYAVRAGRMIWREDYASALTADLNQLGGAKLSGHVQCLSTFAECDMVLFRMGLVQSTGLIYDFFLFNPPAAQPVRYARQFFWNEMLTQPPEVIIVRRGGFPPGPVDYDKLQLWPHFAAWLRQNYEVRDQKNFRKLESGPAGFRLYVRRKTPLPLALR
jgi:hypothetical protein